MRSVKVGVVQAAPVLFDREATLEKAIKLIEEAAKQNVELIVFPESFIPAYPRGLSFGTVIGSRAPEGRKTWERYWANSVEVPSETTEILGKAARDAGLYLVMGITERESVFGNGTLYCTILYFDSLGNLLGKHRKVKPTGTERLVWGEGDGSTLTVINTPFGKVGGLICWENYMPLARSAMYTKGVDIYLAPTADSRESWQSTMQHISLEGRCFVIGCNQFVRKDMYPEDLPGVGDLENQPEIICKGGSVIYSPLGELLAGPLYDEEGILYADLDMSEVSRGKLDMDVVGHYARPDIFQLIINEKSQTPGKFL